MARNDISALVKQLPPGEFLYLDMMPKLPWSAPEGTYLVHNNVRPTRHLGSGGFRAWLQKDLVKREICPCGRAPELGAHYRVSRKGGA